MDKSAVGRIGGLRRIILHGNPGTKEGRRLGGLRSFQSHRKKEGSPFIRRKIFIPKKNKFLAEFIGILLGDGGITSRQVTITLHKQDDKEYARYVSALTEKLFFLSAPVKNRPHTNVSIILISRTALVDFLQKMNISSGNKVKNQVDVPHWIKKNKFLRTFCIRGLFDTDGCFYVDKHFIRDKIYKNAGMNFTNRSVPLLQFFKNTLIEIGFAPTQTSKYCIVLRKEADIVRYFSEIGSSNSKHINKFRAYLEEKGRVPKRS